MVDRRHSEHALAGELERRDLHHHRQRLDDEYAAHDQQHDLLAHDHGDRAERRAEAERTHVAHEHFGRIRVEPEEAQARAGDRAADHRKLAGARDVGKLQVLREDGVSGDVGEDAERRPDHHRRHDRESVEPVGQVHRVARADDHAPAERDEAEHAERIADRLEERHDEVGLRRQRRREAAADPAREELEELHVVRRRDREREVHGGDEADHRLPEELGLRRKAPSDCDRRLSGSRRPSRSRRSPRSRGARPRRTGSRDLPTAAS